MAGCDAVEIEDPNEPKESESSLKVAHAAGETRVPAQAERVVALSAGALDTALALGLKPKGPLRSPMAIFRATSAPARAESSPRAPTRSPSSTLSSSWART